ncbi:hypothetical protein QBC38DRAFT_482316 [Podospora fimiseda]|uniref:F-box domain-containing protein n=1 Tax=Podospora fimiseda TaxID=252190 RepID=A0AAN7GS57_9PEZI|nr:hypothetical protein QBC38DRAFT_482316 [Podospora fimiseda]
MTFSNLPPELNIFILSFIPSPTDLASLLKSSPDLWKVYLKNKYSILKSLILLACPNLTLRPSQLTIPVIISPKLPYNPEIPRLCSANGRLECAPIGPDPSFMSHKNCTEVFIAMNTNPYLVKWVRLPSYEAAMADPNKSLTLKRARYFIQVEGFRPLFEEFMAWETSRDTEMKCLECGQKTGKYLYGRGWSVCIRRYQEMKMMAAPLKKRKEKDDDSDDDEPLSIWLNKFIAKKEEEEKQKQQAAQKKKRAPANHDDSDSDDDKPLMQVQQQRIATGMLKRQNPPSLKQFQPKAPQQQQQQPQTSASCRTRGGGDVPSMHLMSKRQKTR